MRYWVVKGRPYNDWHQMLRPGGFETWHTGKPPNGWATGDRVFCWESSPSRKLVGLAEISSTDEGLDKNGDQLFRLRYRSRYLPIAPTIEALRSFSPLSGASFLKAGPSGTVFPLTVFQGQSLFELLIGKNDELSDLWPDLQTMPDVDGALEGRLVPTSHLRRERDPDIVLRKKQSVLASNGCLSCEVCAFDFAKTYGPLGKGFCEIHHLKPLADNESEVITNLDDLAVVCSNCHRMLHRRIGDQMIGLEDLQHLKQGGRG